jgi:hypothetical protein
MKEKKAVLSLATGATPDRGSVRSTPGTLLIELSLALGFVTLAKDEQPSGAMCNA